MLMISFTSFCLLPAKFIYNDNIPTGYYDLFFEKNLANVGKESCTSWAFSILDERFLAEQAPDKLY